MDLAMPAGEETMEEAQTGAESSLRRCIVTREALEKDRLIRFVLGPEDEVFPDLAGKLPGLWAWG